MKKTIILAVLALGAMTANAQAIEQPKFFDNWSVGLDGGVTTPLTHHAFFGQMRGASPMTPTAPVCVSRIQRSLI